MANKLRGASAFLALIVLSAVRAINLNELHVAHQHGTGEEAHGSWIRPLQPGLTFGRPERAIPKDKLQKVLDPTGYAQVLMEQASLDANGQPIVVLQPQEEAFGSTPDQDTGKCPLVKLPSLMALATTTSLATGLSGVWRMPSSGVALASFGQNFLSNSWNRINIRDLDDRLAFKAEIRSERQLRYLYNWYSQAEPMNYPAIAALDHAWSNGFIHTPGHQLVPVASLNGYNSSSRLSTIFSLTDCENRLLFVVRIQRALDPTKYPAGMDVYDRLGNLVAHALADPIVARYQFVDPSGRRIAIAESPGLWQNVSMANMSRDRDKGNVLPFEMQIDAGGYLNASRLLDTEWRWVLAAAMQLRAIQDANGNWPSSMPQVLVIIYWVFCVLGVVALLGVCFALYRVVYPYRKGYSLQHFGAEAKTASFPEYTAVKNKMVS